MKKARLVIDAAIAVAMGFAIFGNEGLVGSPVSADVAAAVVGGGCKGPPAGTIGCTGSKCAGTAKVWNTGATRTTLGSSPFCVWSTITNICYKATDRKSVV